MIIDRREQRDLLYIIPLNEETINNDNNFIDLETNYFLGFEFNVIGKNENDDDSKQRVIAYLKFGVGERIRFFPEMLTSIIPRLFTRKKEINQNEYINMLYSN